MKELKKKHSSRPVGGAETGSQVERTRSKAVAGGSGEVADCGAPGARLQLASRSAAGRPSNRPQNPGLQRGETKPQISD